MTRSLHRLATVAAAALGLLLAGGAAWAAYPEPQRGTFTAADAERVKLEDLASPWRPGQDCGRSDLQIEGPQAANDDADGAHYARGNTLVIHIFINHSGGTWDLTERQTAGAKAYNAGQRYLSHSPAGANLSFDASSGTDYFYYNPTLGYDIPADGMSWAICDDALVAIGFADTDGNGSPCNELSESLQNWNGGWDNVIMSFQPADITGRAFASYGCSRVVNYTDDVFSVWWHEWGHSFGACDEYEEGGQCNGGIDCGACQSTYLPAVVNNGNCDLAACPSDVTCVMRTNADAVCSYTWDHWGWNDADLNGVLDYLNRRLAGGAGFTPVYQTLSGGWWTWSSTTGGFGYHQTTDTWAVTSLRSPATANYDLRLYAENNHEHLLASSGYVGTSVDFVVADYNHDHLGIEHMQAYRSSGVADDYRIQYESGTTTLYPDGAVRSYGWGTNDIAEVYDVPLFGGETVTFTLDITSGLPDLSFALYKSNGTYYWAGRSSYVIQGNSAGAGGTESFTYTVPSDDIYGLVVWANSDGVSGNYTILIGPTPFTLAEESPFYSAFDLRLFNYDPIAGYWAWAGVRPDGATNVDLGLYDDSIYQSLLDESNTYGNASMEWIAVDYNHASSGFDYLRVARVSGADNHRTMWEQSADVLSGVSPTESWTSPNLAKIWDVSLTGGTNYFFREYHSMAATFECGLYLYSSASGDYYRPRNTFEVFSNNPTGDGGEWFNYTPAVTDWYGLVLPVFDASTTSYSLWMGPDLGLAEDVAYTRSDEVVFGSASVTTTYWTVFGVRPSAGGEASTWLYGDDAYTITTLAASDQVSPDVRYVVGDYNHSALGTVYPRFRRESGTSMTYEWEGGSESLTYTAGGENTYDRVWPAGDVVEAFDIFVPAGSPIGIVVQDLSGVMDLGCELFASAGAPYESPRGTGVDFADAQGVGGTEGVTYMTGGSDDWYGLVVFNKSTAGGNYRIRVFDYNAVAVGQPRPVVFALASGPNPFLRATTLRYSLPAEGDANLTIYDVQGRALRTLVQGRVPAGRHEANWDGTDAANRPVASGIYLARFSAGRNQRVVKLVRGQ